MYCNHFGLKEKPFEMTANPKYLFLNKPNDEVLNSLFYGVQNKRGIIIIIGEVGTGKTTILNALRDSLDKKTKVAFIFNTDISFKQLLNLALGDLGLPMSKNMTVAEILQKLYKFAIEQSKIGGNVVLIVDEAQNLSKSELENIRLLSNIETRQMKLIQILLSGQPKLDYKLSKSDLEHLFQRISIKRYITNLDEKDTYKYIKHRLSTAGYKGKALFDKNSLKLIWDNSRGVPRKINVLCEQSLIIAYAREILAIDEKIVKEAIRYSPYSYSRNYPVNFNIDYKIVPK